MNNRIALWRDAPDNDASAELAALLDWASVIIEAEPGGGKRGFLIACAAAFGFPDYFGHNWDAFEECLCGQEFDEVDDLDEADGLLVLWSGWGDLAAKDPEEFATAISVFRDVLAAWDSDDLQARVVLVGDGPELALHGHGKQAERAFEADDDLLEAGLAQEG
ncbi:MAG: barstar family protein [Candidatus Nanopelagicales bacterium]